MSAIINHRVVFYFNARYKQFYKNPHRKLHLDKIMSEMQSAFTIKWYIPKKTYKLDLKDFIPLEHDLIIVFFPTCTHEVDILVHSSCIILGVPFETSCSDYHALPRRVRYYLSGNRFDLRKFFPRGSPQARMIDIVTMLDIEDVKMFSILYKTILRWNVPKELKRTLWNVLRIKKTLFFLRATTSQIIERNKTFKYHKHIYQPKTGGIYLDEGSGCTTPTLLHSI